ncbi:MAG: glycosyltransferase [Bacteroidales bacterium]|jgi:hypothetical protein|nr:glycosyltransferase [Bacteroidales bacterium]
MFANKYLQKHNTVSCLHVPVKINTGIIVVIPCIDEPDILLTLNSLNSCDTPFGNVEVLIVINHSETSGDTIKQNNLKTKLEIEGWVSGIKNETIKFFVIGPVEFKKKWAGAGLARKKGMDEAVCRFNHIRKPDGIIVSLDADTLVEKNYLVEVEKHFSENPKHVGATIAFRHETKGLPPKHLEGIRRYEKHLYYYKEALKYTGYPFAMFTIGSAFAVKVDAYVHRGGMNRRQAGEDFYFLQNLVQIGTVGEISSTKVYPSARLSNRVPFGTGPILQKWMNGEKDLAKTYNFKAFVDLKCFFDMRTKLFKMEQTEYENLLSVIPESVSDFLVYDNFWIELDNLNKNCSTSETFQVRFFQTFNAFKILKYINFVHKNHYRMQMF